PSLLRPAPLSAPFPYTTLFRSDPRPRERARAERSGILDIGLDEQRLTPRVQRGSEPRQFARVDGSIAVHADLDALAAAEQRGIADRKSTRLNSSHVKISYAVFC